ncbi:MarR family winged helix-turn-helix transcriptional regulator [Nonomuraea sp. NPDC003727]
MSSEQAGSADLGDPPYPVSAVDLADEFGRTAKLLGGRLTSRLAGHDLSMPRAHLLVALIRSGPQRVTQLANQIGVTQGTASTLVDALVREGLLERCTDPLDGRATRLAVTDLGHERAQAWLHDYELAADEIFGTLSDRQRSALLVALRLLSAAKSPSDG